MIQTNGLAVLDVRSWNGKELFDHWIYPGGKEKYEIDDSPNHRAISVFVPPIQWPDVAVHNTWWANPATPEERLARVGRPEDYRLVGRQMFRGHDCYDLEFMQKGGVKRILLAGVTDQRVYGTGGLVWYDDYREVAPGRWMPMSMGYSGRTMKVTSIEVDQPLPDSLFEMKSQVGAQVTDYREDPYLSYVYKEDMTADDWANIRADAKARAAREAAAPLPFGGLQGGALRALAERRARELAGRPATQPAR